MVNIPTLLQQASAGTPEESWEFGAIRRVHMLHSQLDSAIAQAQRSTIPELRAIDFMDAGSPYMQKLATFYRENLSLARLLDNSDLLLHAEGPGAADHSPSLSAVNWLCAGAEKHLKHLISAMLPMSAKDNRAAARDVDLRLSGMAPGSLYLGFTLAGLDRTNNTSVLSRSDSETTVQQLRQSIYALPVVPQFVDSDRMNNEIMEALPDPALRDAAMVAAYELSPTGQRGIHTLEISSPNSPNKNAQAPQQLGQRERVVLRAALRGDPMMRKTTRGSFVGVLRAIDLDRNRITLRNISDDIPVLRCAIRQGDTHAKQYLDRVVRVEGQYEANAEGQPRLMRIEAITLVQNELAASAST